MTKDEAAKSLGVSPRTLNRLQTATGVIPTYTKAEKGNYQLADYSDAQVERMRMYMVGGSNFTTADKLDPYPRSSALNGSTALASVITQADAIATIDKTAANVALLAESIARAVEKSLRTPKVELTDKMVLSLAEASKLSGIPPRRLIKAQIWREGRMIKLPLGYKDDDRYGRGWRFKRLELIEYIKKG